MLAPYSHLPLTPPRSTVLLMALQFYWNCSCFSSQRSLLVHARGCLTCLKHFCRALSRTLFFPWLYDNIPSLYVFGLPPVPLVILFHSLSRQLLLCPLSLMLDLKGLALKKFGLLFPLFMFSLNDLCLLSWHHYHPYVDGSQSWCLFWYQT